MLLSIYLLLKITPSKSWGQDGHEIVANIAYSRLSIKSQEKTCSILSNNSSKEGQTCLGSIANWADAYRYSSVGKWSKALHFIDVQDSLVPNGCHYNNTDNCTFVYERDCVDDVCVAGAIANYSTRLITQRHDDDDAAESLKFLTHFVGDIHQPLHVSRASDYGGNSIHVYFPVNDRDEKHTNLHSIWDTYMIKRTLEDSSMNQTEYQWYLTHLLETIYREDVEDWLECSTYIEVCPSIWAEESLYEALQSAYSNEYHEDIVDGDQISMEYYYSRMRVVEVQLLKGAVRLASLLEFILEKYDIEMQEEEDNSVLWRLFSSFGRAAAHVSM